MTESADRRFAAQGLAAGFAMAQAEYGLSKASVLAAYAKYRPATRPKVLLSEYLAFRLYDPALDPQCFIGADAARKLAWAINRRAPNRRIIGNKLHWDAILRGMGFEVPEVQASFGPSAGPDVPRLTSRAELRQFLAREARFPIFGKPVQGQNSQQVAAIDGFDPESSELALWPGGGEKLWNFARPLERRFLDRGYVFQSAIRQHPAIEAAIGRGVGCLRIITFFDAEGVRILGAAWKIPAPGRATDAIHLGGMIGAVDPGTGRVGPVLDTFGPGAQVISHHPGTGVAVSGLVVPHWKTICQHTRAAAEVLHNLPLVGWDIAIGPNGPIFVEANSSPSVWILQIGQAKGFYTPEMKARFTAEMHRQKRLFGFAVTQGEKLARARQQIMGRIKAAFRR